DQDSLGRRLYARRRCEEIVRRLLPKSLIGQLALVMALALLVAQAINFGIVFSERTRAVRTQVEGPAVARFVGLAQRAAALPAARARGPPDRDRISQTLRLSLQFQDGTWLNGRMFTPRPDPWIWLKLGASTLLIYLLLLGAVVLLAIRLGRPLKDLTAAAKSF